MQLHGHAQKIEHEKCKSLTNMKLVGEKEEENG